jgi:hypothetical protein
MPSTATRSPAFAGAFRRALNVVSPAHSSGAAPADDRNAGVFLVPAVHEVAAATEIAIAAGPAEKSDAYSLTDAPALNTCADFVDPTDHLMARDSRKPDAGEDRVDGRRIRMANATGLNPDTHLTWSRLCQRSLDEIKHTRTCSLNGSISCAHLGSPRRFFAAAA